MRFLLGLFIIVLFGGCHPGGREMPVTTSSEEARELFIKGRDLAENFMTEEADTLFKRAVQLDPEFALAYLWLLDQSGISQAKRVFGKVSPGEAMMIKAYDAFLSGSFMLCDQMIDSLVSLYPKDKHCQLYAGRLFYNRDVPKAIHYFKKASKLDKYYDAAYGYLGVQYRESGKFEEAEEAYLRCIDLRSNSATTHQGYGILLTKMGREEEALQEFRNAIVLEPTNPYPCWYIIWIYILQDNYEQTRKYCDLLYELESREIDTEGGMLVDNRRSSLCLLAIYHYIHEDVSGSLESIDRLIALYELEGKTPDLFVARHLKAWYEMEAGLSEKALVTLQQSLKLAGEADIEEDIKLSLQLRFHGTLSILYGNLDLQERAGEHLVEARKIFDHKNNDRTDKNYMRLFEGVYAIQRGDYELAISQLQIPADRRSVSCAYYLALAYEFSGHRDLAIKYYQMAYNNTNPYFAGFFHNKSKNRIEELENEQ